MPRPIGGIPGGGPPGIPGGGIPAGGMPRPMPGGGPPGMPGGGIPRPMPGGPGGMPGMPGIPLPMPGGGPGGMPGIPGIPLPMPGNGMPARKQGGVRELSEPNEQVGSRSLTGHRWPTAALRHHHRGRRTTHTAHRGAREARNGCTIEWGADTATSWSSNTRSTRNADLNAFQSIFLSQDKEIIGPMSKEETPLYREGCGRSALPQWVEGPRH